MKPDVEIHPNALKHMGRDDVLAAWQTVTKSIMRASDDEPPRWLCVGWLANGASVEIIAVEQVGGWLIIHANTPVQKNLRKRYAIPRGGQDDSEEALHAGRSGNH